jgi:signal transduction histidine kinase
MNLGRAARLALCPVGLGVGAVDLATRSVGPFDGVVEALAGWSVIACGVTLWDRRPATRAGGLLAAAGFGWLLSSWNTPAIGSALGFSVGLVVYAVAPALFAHAAFVFAGTRLRRIERAGLTLAYIATIGVLGLLPALLFDPAAQGCASCPANPLRVVDVPGLYRGLNQAGVWLGLVWAPLVIGLLVLHFVRCNPALRAAKAPLTIATIGYLAVVTWDYRLDLDTGFLTANTPTGQTAALFVIAAAVAWTWIRARRIRGKIARLVVDVAGSPEPGKLRDRLAAMLGDERLRLAYPLSDGQLVNAEGAPVRVDGELNPTTVTPLVRDGHLIAVLTHRPGLFDDPSLAHDIVAGSSLALDNERLQAQLSAQLIELRASRTRIAEAGDAERRRLERDLHDGAQQQFAALQLSASVARIKSDNAVLEKVEEELRAAAVELRNLARGIFPAVLAEEGLGAALESLAEESRVRILGFPSTRFSQAIETAAYFVIARAVPRDGNLTIAANIEGDRLVVTLAGAGSVAGASDRLAAVDGQLASEPDGLIRVVLPCVC